MINKCRICGYVGETEVVTAKEMMQGTRESFDYFICPECGCLQIVSILDDLGKYYGANYYSYTEPDSSKKDVEGKVFERILDVGCGAGAFLCSLYSKKGCTDLTGCDPFIEKDLHYENGVNIYKKTIHEMEGTYNQIYLMDSFEHVTDPHEVMDSIHRLLARNGCASISIPVFPNIAYQMFGTNWYQLDAPRHIFLHSQRSMEVLANMHGLKVSGVKYDSNGSQVVRSYLYQKDITFNEQTYDCIRKYFTEEQLDQLEENSKTANENEKGDHAIFYLIRKEDVGMNSYGSLEAENL